MKIPTHWFYNVKEIPNPMLAFDPDTTWGHCTNCGTWSYALRRLNCSADQLCPKCFEANSSSVKEDVELLT